MHVFITGASGGIGLRLTKLLLSHGHTVTGLARSEASADKISAAGAKVLRGTITDLDVLAQGAGEADAAVHTAFPNPTTGVDWIQVCAEDRAATEAIANALANGSSTLDKSKRIFINTGGMLGNLGDEEAGKIPTPATPRYLTEELTTALSKSLGIRTYNVRLPPVTHHAGMMHPFIGGMILAAKKLGFSPYVGEGTAHWPAVHYDDAARMYLNILESDPTKVPTSVPVHPIQDRAIANKQFAELIGKKLGLEVKSLSPDIAMQHLGFIAMIAQFDVPASGEKSEKWFNWKPTEQGLLEELEASDLDIWKS
ncbi:hypothetical protein BCR39DRAFT_543215 [Naematelia encephala]|uniref:NAD-dependent epimerase/dehydratase domain-containing protein n=1 Tax=Naematelia encephala TaxID=71784 RepID=A0A1Y2AT37_9TREE|nr:hypothetical protein BCR39DRAFT_543215 [Naematelia encephala]